MPVRRKVHAKIHSSAEIIWILFIVVFVIGAIFLVYNYSLSPIPYNITSQTQSHSFDFSNQKFTLDNQQLAMVNGVCRNPNGYMASIADRTVNSAGNHAAAILTVNPGGSGAFLYLVGASLNNGNETYSDPVLLGDRVQIVTVSVDNPQANDNGGVTVVYFDHNTNEPMASKPGVKVVVKYAFQADGNLISVLH